MSTQLKEIYFTPDFVEELSVALRNQVPGFDSDAFQRLVYADGWSELELKQKMRRITLSLQAALPADYATALAHLRRVAPSFSGFNAMVFPDFVECCGLAEWELSMGALAEFTPLCSSEFAVRPFLQRDPARGVEILLTWTQSDNSR